MARTITEIYEEMLAVKAKQTALNDLDSSSDTALFKLFLYVTAVGINLLEQIYSLILEELKYVRDTTPTNTKKWWIHLMLYDYQFNTDNSKGVLQLDKEIPYYNTIDEDSKIIKFCSVTQTEKSRQINIKVTKADSEGLPIQLSNDEYLSVEQYVDRKKPAGANTNVVSLPPDEAKVEASIFFDGAFVYEEVKNDVLDTIENFFKNLSKTSFTGEVSKTKLILEIEKTSGVLDVDSSSFKLLCKANSETNYTDVKVYYSTLSGYIYLDRQNTNIELSIKK